MLFLNLLMCGVEAASSGKISVDLLPRAAKTVSFGDRFAVKKRRQNPKTRGSIISIVSTHFRFLRL